MRYFQAYINIIKQAIDNDLKVACEELINRRSDAATQPIRDFLERATALRPTKPSSSIDQDQTSTSLSNHPFAKPADITQINQDFRAACEKETTAWITQLRIYLKDQKTISVLVAPYKTRIVGVYGAFLDLVTKEYPGEVAEGMLSPADVWSLLDRLCN